MEDELVSILIPVYNRENLVGETIDSAMSQTYKNLEIIIVDNCSSDGTWRLLTNYSAKDPRIKIFQNKKNVGPVKNWKICLDYARGKYSKILFSDDLIKETFIENTLKKFKDDTAFVLTGIEIFGSDKKYVSKYQDKKSRLNSSLYLREVLLFNRLDFPVSPGSALFRTKDLKEALIIDLPNNLKLDFSFYGAGNDLLLYLITATRYPNVEIINSVESYFRVHHESFSIANKLSIYYNYSKYYFIEKYCPNYLSKFYTKLLLHSIVRGDKILLASVEKKNIDILFGLNYGLKKIFRV